MRKTFGPLDNVLIEGLFQPISDLVAHRIGVSRGLAACLCIDIASLSWIVSRASGLSDAMILWDAGTGFLDLAILLLGLIALLSLRTLFRMVRGKPGNPLRPAMQPHRAIMLLMLVSRLLQLRIPGLTDAAEIAMLLFATTALYLSACAERPPVRRTRPDLASANKAMIERN